MHVDVVFKETFLDNFINPGRANCVTSTPTKKKSLGRTSLKPTQQRQVTWHCGDAVTAQETVLPHSLIFLLHPLVFAVRAEGEAVRLPCNRTPIWKPAPPGPPSI